MPTTSQRNITVYGTPATAIAKVTICKRASSASIRMTGQGTALQPGLAIWLTGLPSAGKTTLGREVVLRLRDNGERVELLDGDIMRAHLGRNLGFSREDREENLRRIAFVAELLTRNGIHVVIAAISPYAALRQEFRRRFPAFLEVFVNAPLAVCQQRDVKGLYDRHRRGEIKGLTGVDDPYEQPVSPEVECQTDLETFQQSADKIMAAIQTQLRDVLPVRQLRP